MHPPLQAPRPQPPQPPPPQSLPSRGGDERILLLGLRGGSGIETWTPPDLFALSTWGAIHCKLFRTLLYNAVEELFATPKRGFDTMRRAVSSFILFLFVHLTLEMTSTSGKGTVKEFSTFVLANGGFVPCVLATCIAGPFPTLRVKVFCGIDLVCSLLGSLAGNAAFLKVHDAFKTGKRKVMIFFMAPRAAWLRAHLPLVVSPLRSSMVRMTKMNVVHYRLGLRPLRAQPPCLNSHRRIAFVYFA